MKKETIKKLLPATTVFVFVAFCFAIANTFGSTYAATTCPTGWTAQSSNNYCTKYFHSTDYEDVKVACENTMKEFGLTPTWQPSTDFIAANHCRMVGSDLKDAQAWISASLLNGGTSGDGNYEYTAFLKPNGGAFASGVEVDSYGQYYAKCTTNTAGGSCTIESTDIPTPTRSGYLFVGWSTSSTGENPVKNITLTGNRTYYAVWEEKTSEPGDGIYEYTAILQPNGGSFASGVTVDTYGQHRVKCTTNTVGGSCTIKAADIPQPTKSGYTFTGWSTSTTGEQSVRDITLTGNRTYYAVWAESSSGTTYTLKFYPNGGTLDDTANSVKTCTLTSGSSTCRIDLPTATRKEYVFKGWSLDSNCSDAYNKYFTHLNVDSKMNNESYYACWEKAESSGPTDDGYKFLAFLSANGGSFASGVTLDSNNYYRASCVAESATSSCTIKASDMPKPTKSGYTFKGWSKSTTGENAMTDITLTTNGTYYAVWTRNSTNVETKKYTITFDPNGGTLDGKTSDNCSTTTGSCSITTLPIAKKDGYTFGGWGTSKSCTTGETTTINLTSDATYYACWSEKTNQKVARNYYTVKFELDGGKFVDGRTSQVHVTDDQIITYAPKTNPVKEGYVFDGWYNGNVKYNLGGVVRENLTLTAHWKKIETNCTAVCNSGDVYEPSIDKCISVQKFDGKTYYTSLLEQEKTCTNGLYEKVKDGTSSGNDCNANYNIKETYRPENTCKIESACTSGTAQACVEKWEGRCFKTYAPTDKKCTSTIKYYEVKYELDGGMFAGGDTGRKEIIPSNELLDKPVTNPVKEGYEFVGWYIENDEFDFSKKLTGDVTIKARWQEIGKSNCKYTCNSGDLFDPSTGNCISAQKFGGETFYSSTLSGTRTCQYGIFELPGGSSCTSGSCGKYSCGSEYTLQDSYVTKNTCQIKTNCDSATGTTGNCEEVWKAHCYKTYKAEEDCSEATKYKVEFKLNNGNLYINDNKTTKTTYELANIDYTKYVAKKDKYIFKGWSEGSNCSSIITKKTEDLTENKTLYACYMEDKTGQEIGKNPQTSSTVLYLVYLIGILALCYAVYYSYSYAKSRR